jgi:hypothetical protein
MKKSVKIAIGMTAAAFAAALMLALLRMGQSSNEKAKAGDDDKAEGAAKAKALARTFEANARTLTIYERQGNLVKTVDAARSTPRRCSHPTPSASVSLAAAGRQGANLHEPRF